jgi:hypothetical protein
MKKILLILGIFGFFNLMPVDFSNMPIKDVFNKYTKESLSEFIICLQKTEELESLNDKNVCFFNLINANSKNDKILIKIQENKIN